MPIYEYRCTACHAKQSVFVRTATSPVTATCERCGSADLSRVFSRVAVLRRGSDNGFDEGSLADIDESDPRAMARWVRKMSREMGEPLDDEMLSELDRMEAGEMPAGFDDDDDDDDDFDDLD